MKKFTDDMLDLQDDIKKLRRTMKDHDTQLEFIEEKADRALDGLAWAEAEIKKLQTQCNKLEETVEVATSAMVQQLKGMVTVQNKVKPLTKKQRESILSVSLDICAHMIRSLTGS